MLGSRLGSSGVRHNNDTKSLLKAVSFMASTSKKRYALAFSVSQILKTSAFGTRVPLHAVHASVSGVRARCVLSLRA